jgi:hypothetical protein
VTHKDFTWFRRYLVLLTLSFWLGGFTFYGGVVIPVGRGQFGPEFSRVTAVVTTALNIAAAVLLLGLAWDGLAGRDPVAWRRRGRWLTWLAAATALLTLFGLHVWLDRMMAQHQVALTDPVFYPVHRAYLWIGAAQCLAVVVHAGLMLASWRDADRQPPPAAPAAPPG